MNFTPRILLYPGTGIFAALIRLQTRGRFAHAAVQVNASEIIEAAPEHGVRRAPLDLSRPFESFDVPSMTEDDWIVALAFLHEQIGRPYDIIGVLRFITRRPDTGRRSWFCSELVFAAVLAAGTRLLDRVEPWEVSPQVLSLSPLLRNTSGRARLMAAAQQHSDPRIKFFLNASV